MSPDPAEQPVAESTEWTSKPPSSIFNVSVRAWIAVIVVLTVCAMSVLERKVNEPLYTLAGLVVGCYFGQNLKQGKQ